MLTIILVFLRLLFAFSKYSDIKMVLTVGSVTRLY